MGNEKNNGRIFMSNQMKDNSIAETKDPVQIIVDGVNKSLDDYGSEYSYVYTLKSEENESELHIEDSKKHRIRVNFLIRVKGIRKLIYKNKQTSIEYQLELITADGSIRDVNITRRDLATKTWAESAFPDGKATFNDWDCAINEQIVICQLKNGVPQTNVIKEEGLIPDSSLYVFGDRIIGPADIQMKAETGYECINDYEIDDSLDNPALGQWIMTAILKFSGSGNAIVMLIFTILAHFFELLTTSKHAIKIVPRFVLMVIGRTGFKKSSLAKAILSTTHLSAGVVGLPTSTPVSVSKTLLENHSMAMLFDDVRPKKYDKTDSNSLQNVEMMCRCVGDPGSGRKTSRNSSEAVDCNAMAASTAEKQFSVTPSTLLRMVELTLLPEECSLEKLDVLQMNRGKINTFIFRMLNYNAYDRSIVKFMEEGYPVIFAEVKERYQEITNETRILNSHTQLLCGFKYISFFLNEKCGVSTEELNSAEQTLISCLEKSARIQSQAIRDIDPDLAIKESIFSFFEDDKEKTKYSTLTSNGSTTYACSGYKENAIAFSFGSSYFVTAAKQKILLDLVNTECGLSLKMPGLKKIMHELGLIKRNPSTAPTTFGNKITIDKEDIRVLAFNKNAIMNLMEEN